VGKDLSLIVRVASIGIDARVLSLEAAVAASSLSTTVSFGQTSAVNCDQFLG
jgi:hypothetical protein